MTVLFFLCVLPTFAQKAPKRVALVIGNGTYNSYGSLKKTPKDAVDMSEALADLGFEVIRGINEDKAETERLIEEFAKKLAKSRGVGVVYFAGLGFHLKGKFFLFRETPN